MTKIKVNPPRQLKLPESVAANPDLKKAFDDLNFIVHQLYERTGKGIDYVADNQIKKLYPSKTADDIEAKQHELKAFYQKNTATNKTINLNTVINKKDATSSAQARQENQDISINNEQPVKENDQINVANSYYGAINAIRVGGNKDPNASDSVIVTSTDIITSESVTIVCNNAIDINVTLNSNPDDNESVTIKRYGTGIITLISSKDIHTLESYDITTVYDNINLKFIALLNKWIIL